ncbi:MAG: TetR family transcriptional regulator [Actinophytocola sp.]|nr:TetR family transcriptional regulator [Actinophytocola sp.]
MSELLCSHRRYLLLRVTHTLSETSCHRQVHGGIVLGVSDVTERGADGRTSRWDEHKAQRRLDVLDAAIDAIERHGIEVTVKQIADELGLPRPVVYRHFHGRSDLDEQIRARIIEQLLAELEPALRPDGTVADAVRHAVGTYLAWVDQHPRLHHFLGAGRHHERVTGSPVVSGARNAIAAQLAALFTTALAHFGKDTSFARPMAYGVIGLVDGVVNAWRSDPDSVVAPAEVVGRLSDSILALIESNARALGVAIDADTPVQELLRESEAQPGGLDP